MGHVSIARTGKAPGRIEWTWTGGDPHAVFYTDNDVRKVMLQFEHNNAEFSAVIKDPEKLITELQDVIDWVKDGKRRW